MRRIEPKWRLPPSCKVTGRLRGEDNVAIEGYTVQAFDKDPKVYFHPDDRLGKAKTGPDGSFAMEFGEEAFKDWFEGEPEVYLTVRDAQARSCWSPRAGRTPPELLTSRSSSRP